MRARHHLLIWALQNTKGQMFSHWDRMTALQTSLWRQSPPPLLPGPHPWPVWVIICRGIFDGKTDITHPFLCQRSKLAAWGPHSTNQALKWSGLSGGVLTSFLIGASKYLETGHAYPVCRYSLLASTCSCHSSVFLADRWRHLSLQPLFLDPL